MDALIINSPLFREKNPLYDEDSLPPIGLGYIATALKIDGQSVELWDTIAENTPLNELIDSVKEAKPSFIALNIFTTNYSIVKDFVNAIDYSVHFIIGGLSTKNLYKEIIDWETSNPIDIVTGDGELIIVDLVKDALIEKPFHEQITPPRRVFKVDLTSIYFVKDISDVPLDRSFFKNEPIQHLFGFKEANIITSRGCIYNCAFCSAAYSINREYGIREKSEASIIDEIKYIKSVYPEVQSIRVLDDLFLKNSKTIQKAINVFSKFPETQWRSMAHVMTFNKVPLEKIIELGKTNCNELFIGIESGSPKILKQIHKTHKIQIVKDSLFKLFKAGINVKGYFIYGFPNETEEDFKLTFKLALALKEEADKCGVIFRPSVFQFRPYHGTELFHKIETKLKEDDLAIKPNEELSSLVGRLQFNFHGGNYSMASLEIVHKYIYLTTNLNSPKLLESLKKQACQA